MSRSTNRKTLVKGRRMPSLKQHPQSLNRPSGIGVQKRNEGQTTPEDTKRLDQRTSSLNTFKEYLRKPLPPSPLNIHMENDIHKNTSDLLLSRLRWIGSQFDFDIVCVVKVLTSRHPSKSTTKVYPELLAVYKAHQGIEFALNLPISVYIRPLKPLEWRIYSKDQLPNGFTYGLSRGIILQDTRYIISCFSAIRRTDYLDPTFISITENVLNIIHYI